MGVAKRCLVVHRHGKFTEEECPICKQIEKQPGSNWLKCVLEMFHFKNFQKRESKKMSVIEDFANWYREQVTKRAKSKWENAGKPEGRDLEFWTEAEKEFPIPQSIAEPWGMGYGADDPGLVGIIENYKSRYK